VGCALLADEGCGEVQTPVRLPRGARVELGEPILFRPAKAGEVAEHFAEYALLDARMRVVGRAPTYRGLGRCLH
jgi:D-serine deaminase-like pyridoxal phosphate-dependent protein